CGQERVFCTERELIVRLERIVLQRRAFRNRSLIQSQKIRTVWRSMELSDHITSGILRRAAMILLAVAPILLSLDSPARPLANSQNTHVEVPRPMVIAHRGGALESTENTIAAFQRAVKLGAAGIETDIRLTRDG